jgi:hypothetical protein
VAKAAKVSNDLNSSNGSRMMRRPAGVCAITHCTLKLRSYRHFGMTPRDITT